MPINPKPKLLTEADVRAAEDAFLQDVKRELHIMAGDAWSRKPLSQLLADARDRVRVQSYTTGPSSKYSSPNGGMRNAQQCAEELLKNADTMNLLASYGPDPVEETANRLAGLGVDRDEALQRARRTVGRNVDDGRVFVMSKDGTVYSRGAAPKGRDLSEGDLVALRDHSHAVTAATRMILEEIDNGVDVDGRPAGYTPPTHAEILAAKRDQVAGAL